MSGILRHGALAITLLATVFFYKINAPDVTGDAAHYLYRSVGYFDYMTSVIQTTPLQWLRTVPWWTYLGFHDAPALYFIITHLVLLVSDGSVFAARMFNACMGIAAGMLMWWYAWRRGSPISAWLALALYIGLTPLVAVQRGNLIEAHLPLWLTIGMIGFFESAHDRRWAYISAAAFGAAMLTKYTAIFAFIGPIIWLVLHPHIFKTKLFWQCTAIFVVVTAPIVIYNTMMWWTVGHPDMQFSTVFGFDTSYHWGTFAHVLRDHTSQFGWSVFKNLFTQLFVGLWPIVLVGIVIVAYRAYRKKSYAAIVLTGALIGIVLEGFMLDLGNPHAIPSLTILALILTHASVELSSFFEQKKFAALAIIVAVVSVVSLPARAQVLLSPQHGWQELGDYITAYRNRYKPTTTYDFWGIYRAGRGLAIRAASVARRRGTISDNGYLIYDARLPWFEQLWYIERWNLYAKATHITSSEYVIAEKKMSGFIKKRGYDANRVSYIYWLAAPEPTDKKMRDQQSDAQELRRMIDSPDTPNRIIFDRTGTAQFQIFGPLAQVTK